MNRLRLNFQIDSTEERTQFIKEYLNREEFQKKPLTEDELETCANYILWGKDSDGKNSVQRKEIQIKTKNGTWDTREDESLDALIESPTFSETQLFFNSNTHYKKSHKNFSREKALKEAPPQLIPIFQDLFSQIDSLDLLLNYYDLAHGKRKKPPRPELLQQFSPEQQLQIQEDSTHLNQFKYLKLRHLLVELRRQQYTLKDTYATQIQRHTSPIPQIDYNSPSFDTDINIYPLGVFDIDNRAQLNIFNIQNDPIQFSESELKEISNILWTKRKQFIKDKTQKKFLIDFRDIEHVYNIFLLYYNLEDTTFLGDIENKTDALLRTLHFYMDMANLNEVQYDILHLKMNQQKNQAVADFINKKYNKSYTANYISTIFRQKIIKQINEAAKYHELWVENLFYPENFKRCSTCGQLYLIDGRNFVKKTRSKDGFSNRCKKCDKKDRLRKKL